MQKILIITQKVDMNDDVLGFFHAWIAQFARQYKQVTVICLQKGAYDLPRNVTVLSLGKEKRQSRGAYTALLYKYIWQQRRNYDAVFVHMNPVYIALAGPLWVAWRKKVALWYIHPKADRYLKVAHLFADVIFTARKDSFPFSSPKVRAVGHGIDTARFRPMPAIEKEKNSILYVGRITPIKHLDVLAEAVRLLDKKGVHFTLHLIGGPDARYGDYYTRFKKDLADLEKRGVVVYHGQIPNREMPEWYNAYEVLVNTTPSGSFDKAVLEAMACGTLVVTSNDSYAEVLGRDSDALMFPDSDALMFAERIEKALVLAASEKAEMTKRLRGIVVANHNLETLIGNIKRNLQ